MKLPSGPGRAAPPTPPTRCAQATAACRGVRTLTAEVAVSGRSAASRFRGRLLGRRRRAGVGAPRGGRAVRPAALHLRRDRRRRDAAAAARRPRARARPAGRGARGGRRRAAERGGPARDADRLRAGAVAAAADASSATTGASSPDGARRRRCICIATAPAQPWRLVAVVHRRGRAARRGAPSTAIIRTACRDRSAWRASTRRDADARSICRSRSSQVEINVRARAPTSFRVRRSRAELGARPIDASMSSTADARPGVREDQPDAARARRARRRLPRAADDLSVDRAARHADVRARAAGRSGSTATIRRARPTRRISSGARPSGCGGGGPPRRAARRRRRPREADSDAGGAGRRQQRRGGGAARARDGSGASTQRDGCATSRRRSAPTCRSFSRAAPSLGLERGDLLFPLVDRAGRVGRARAPGVRRQHEGGVRLVGRQRRSRRRRIERQAPSVARSRLAELPTDELGNDLEAPVAARHPEIARIVRALRAAGAIARRDVGQRLGRLRPVRAPRRRGARGRGALATPARRTIVTRTLNRAKYQALAAT